MSARRALLLLAIVAAPAAAQERDYCPSRPGLGTTPCTISRGRASLETAVADWTRDDDTDEREDTLLIGDSQLRIGVSDAAEVQLSWTPFGHVRTRDKAAGTIDHVNGVGDVTLGAKLNLHNPDGKGLSFAVQPMVTLPVGRQPVGQGGWSAGVLAPITYDLSDALNLQLTPEVDAAADEDGRGRHLAYSAVLGLGVKLSEAISLTIEAQALRDEDPMGATTAGLGSVSIAWTTGEDTKLDLGTAFALDGDASDLEIYAGISHRF